MKSKITCIECPIGCAIEVETENGKVRSIAGNGCPRGRTYAENEVVCPKRVVTSTVRMANGKILSVKTDAPVDKANILDIMQKINQTHPVGEVDIGDILVANIWGDVNLVAADYSKYL